MSNIYVRALLNAISMVSIPSAAITIPVDPSNIFGWFALAIGVGLQILKYHLEEEKKDV